MSRTQKILAAAVVGLVLVIGGAAWWLGYFTETPEAATVEAAAQAVQDGAADESGDVAPAGDLDEIDGTWTVTPNADATFIGYRINEVLNTIGDFEVVGRTSDVTGTLTADGTTITAVDVTADMTTLTTDNSARDSSMRSQALETADFPTATFVLAEPIDLGSIPAEGETVSVSAVGDLTIHGVTKRVEFPLDAQVQSGSIVAAGQLQMELADYDINAPSAPIVASVEDTAVLELSLVFDR